MTEGPVRDLTLIRDHFVTLRDALAMNDVARVEAATDALRASLNGFAPEPALPQTAQKLLSEITSLSGDVADTLQSRLRAFDMVIEALRNEESASR